MQTVKQILCPRCREMNLPYLSVCAYCGQPLDPPAPTHLAAPLTPVPASDLPALLLALACFFVALWGLVAAGPLHGMLGILTQPYLLLAWVIVSLVLTGLFLTERFTGDAVPRALLSTRDIMALSWAAAALLAGGQFVKLVIPLMPVITRYEIVSKDGDGCRVEVFVKGQDGDELWRLTGLSRKSEKEVVGIIVRRPGGGSARLPTMEHTPQGDCAIVKYHLMVNGKECDHVDGVGE
jgi:hypothetical protein